MRLLAFRRKRWPQKAQTVTDSHGLRDKNRRLGVFLIVVFLGLLFLSVVFVMLRKYGYA